MRYSKTSRDNAKIGAVLLALVAISMLYNAASKREQTAQKAIVYDVKGLIANCRAKGDNVTITSKALVWDIRSDSFSLAHKLLPYSRRANSKDKPITVFIVLGERDEKVGTYSVSHASAYRTFIDIAVISWPDKTPIGFHSLLSKEPPSSRPVQNKVEYGDPNKAIADWIAGLRN